MVRFGIRWNNYITYQTSGAGSWGEPADTCTPNLYTNGGNGGFIIVTATATTWRSDYYTLGSTYPQCTVGGPAGPPARPWLYGGWRPPLSTVLCDGSPDAG
jgi:hypothetical protein